MAIKILAFTDTHGDMYAIKQLVSKSKKADIIICAGDISNFGNDLDKLAKELIKSNKPILMIPGNHEMTEEIDLFEKKYNIINIHKKFYRTQNFTFFGFGQGGFSDRYPELDRITKQTSKIDNLILVTHAPPYKTKLDKIGSSYVGSDSITDFIKKLKPKLAICGHIHENENKKDKINSTLIINPGPKGKFINLK